MFVSLILDSPAGHKLLTIKLAPLILYFKTLQLLVIALIKQFKRIITHTNSYKVLVASMVLQCRIDCFMPLKVQHRAPLRDNSNCQWKTLERPVWRKMSDSAPDGLVLNPTMKLTAQGPAIMKHSINNQNHMKGYGMQTWADPGEISKLFLNDVLEDV